MKHQNITAAQTADLAVTGMSCASCVGRVFFRAGIPALLRRAPEMNSLVALGAGAAWLYSTVATFAPGLLPADSLHVYYEAAAVIVTLILLGRWLEARAKGQAGDAATPVHMALDGRHVAALALADPIRPEASRAIAELHGLDLRTAMISGDVQATADAVGRQLGIDRVTAGVLPEGKLAAIREMGGGTVFVGDGINDAPALAAAETGIAIGTGTDVAIESAEVVLVGGDPQGVPRAIRLSRAVMRNIRQNLFWAFGYNTALIPVAMGALVPFGGPQLSPMLGAGAMALSSVFVVTNALRLKRAG
ncbi:ATPase, P-type (transporting), HAD superfamily, subfamily IC [Paracoccus halophilus]|uniref:ATPase, P-type (Transporting), HAD superfamily, subfamily IC n=1 Tax=Paracoccus halophilus TaxID=376733 RepID=A0A1I0SRL6_9RHOB|nr:ATPase, P-type (transporting), HAD superfamily, subfamily IC [Paracoccus halophilus]